MSHNRPSRRPLPHEANWSPTRRSRPRKSQTAPSVPLPPSPPNPIKHRGRPATSRSRPPSPPTTPPRRIVKRISDKQTYNDDDDDDYEDPEEEEEENDDDNGDHINPQGKPLPGDSWSLTKYKSPNYHKDSTYYMSALSRSEHSDLKLDYIAPRSNATTYSFSTPVTSTSVAVATKAVSGTNGPNPRKNALPPPSSSSTAHPLRKVPLRRHATAPPSTTATNNRGSNRSIRFSDDALEPEPEPQPQPQRRRRATMMSTPQHRPPPDSMADNVHSQNIEQYHRKYAHKGSATLPYSPPTKHTRREYSPPTSRSQYQGPSARYADPRLKKHSGRSTVAAAPRAEYVSPWDDPDYMPVNEGGWESRKGPGRSTAAAAAAAAPRAEYVSPWDKSDYMMIKEGGWDNKKEFMQCHGLSMHEPRDFDEAKELLNEYRRRDMEAEGVRMRGGGDGGEKLTGWEARGRRATRGGGPAAHNHSYGRVEQRYDQDDEFDQEGDMINPSVGMDGCGDYIEGSDDGGERYIDDESINDDGGYGNRNGGGCYLDDNADRFDTYGPEHEQRQEYDHYEPHDNYREDDFYDNGGYDSESCVDHGDYDNEVYGDDGNGDWDDGNDDYYVD
ncbi:hypothetical protein BU24DRAFT_421077 [Aaosphaeria arxii CBS 175.79]|uniref:Uncharacterized protein n=1 Tax=Aaosphaeria arxii CBS 175.79 TaxID=1450172 RepID=A0A6A5XZB9_9PLEO|nr:uncharacterized protein BU24DRAFT_421077 [Aaosphaeria arxii CBS 175.79]KAF2018061.1 hypothetical protein BU24DRAFT_421077 [Aaosphaeria arxii CBS 175.79]